MKSYISDDGLKVADFEVSMGGMCIFRVPVPISRLEPSLVESHALLGVKSSLPEKPPKKEVTKPAATDDFGFVRSVKPLDDALIEVGTLVCRRSKDSRPFHVLPGRRFRDVFLAVKQIEKNIDGKHVGYFCEDYEKKLHFVMASEVRGISA
jgi:hypothetical protein